MIKVADDPDKSKFTHEAYRIWNELSCDIKEKLLNNVFCGSCEDTTTIIDYVGKTSRNDLVLNGKCKKCGHEVARLIENE